MNECGCVQIKLLQTQAMCWIWLMVHSLPMSDLHGSFHRHSCLGLNNLSGWSCVGFTWITQLPRLVKVTLLEKTHWNLIFNLGVGWLAGPQGWWNKKYKCFWNQVITCTDSLLCTLCRPLCFSLLWLYSPHFPQMDLLCCAFSLSIVAALRRCSWPSFCITVQMPCL